MPRFVLYDNNASVAAQKVRLVLAEKGVRWQTVTMELREGAVMSPEYLRLNPNAAVPTLLADGEVLVESTPIMEYLEEVLPVPRLTPAVPLARARMRVWTKRIDEGAHRSTGIVSMSIYIRYAHLQKTPEARAAYFAKMPDADRVKRQTAAIEHGLDNPMLPGALGVFAKLVDDIDAQASRSRWLVGDDFTLADVACAPYITRLEMLALDKLWIGGRRPHLARWWAALQARPSYKQEIIGKFDDTARAGMRARGEEAWPRIRAMVGM